MCICVVHVVLEPPVLVQTLKSFRCLKGQQGVAHPRRGLERWNTHCWTAKVFVPVHDISITADGRLIVGL